MKQYDYKIAIIDGDIAVENDNCSDFGGMADIADIAFVGTGHALSLQTQPQQKSIGQNRFQNIGKNSVSSIIESYKSAVTKHARRLGYTFECQRLYYDHLIQNENSYYHISNYIKNNVKKWDEDRFFGE